MPEWIKNYKKEKGQSISKIGDNYYLYEVSSKWNKDKKRAQKITNSYIGKITEQGLIPKKVRVQESKFDLGKVSTKDYGLYAFLETEILEMKKQLLAYFKDEVIVEKIIAIAFIKIYSQSPFKRIEHHYNHNYISEVFKDLILDKNSLTSFLRNLGERRTDMVAYMKSNIIKGDSILFDGTNIISNSNKMCLSKQGYNSHGNHDSQFNLLYAFSFKNHTPEYYRILPGNIADVSSFKKAVDESCLKDLIIVADKNFGSNANLNKLLDDELNFVIPLRRSNKEFDATIMKSGDKTNFEGQFIFNNRSIWYFKKKIANSKKVIHTYIDETLRTIEERDYLERINNEYEGYTMESFKIKQYKFGVIMLVTNLDKDSKEIYEIYKTRINIEENYDVYKTLLEADKSYMQNEIALESWAFINHIAMKFIFKLYTKLKKADILKKYSAEDLIEHLRYIKKLKINNKWITSEINTKTIKLLASLDCHIT